MSTEDVILIICVQKIVGNTLVDGCGVLDIQHFQNYILAVFYSDIHEGSPGSAHATSLS